MSETAFKETGGRVSTSSPPSVRDWINLSPEQLSREGYHRRLAFAPAQAQSHTLTETNLGDMISGNDLASTAIQPDAPFVIQLPILNEIPPALHSVAMVALQEWEGYVLEIGEKEFSARLSDITAQSLVTRSEWIETEEAVIPLSEISDGDLKLLRPGSIFRWVIGYEWSASRIKKRVSQIVFRDLPVMTRRDKIEGSEWARKVLRAIKE